MNNNLSIIQTANIPNKFFKKPNHLSYPFNIPLEVSITSPNLNNSEDINLELMERGFVRKVKSYITNWKHIEIHIKK